MCINHNESNNIMFATVASVANCISIVSIENRKNHFIHEFRNNQLKLYLYHRGKNSFLISKLEHCMVFYYYSIHQGHRIPHWIHLRVFWQPIKIHKRFSPANRKRNVIFLHSELNSIDFVELRFRYFPLACGQRKTT